MSDRGDLERGRASYQRRAWADAFAELARADGDAPLEAGDLEKLAWSAALTARDDDFLRAAERLYQLGADAGDCARAARWAFWKGMRLFSLGEPGQAGGWLARAQRMVERAGGDCVECGWLQLPTAVRQLEAGDFEAAAASAGEAAALGDRHGDPDLVAFARNLQGRALLRQGRIEDGMALLDEAMVSVSAGEVSPLVSGLVYCSVIASCQQVFALDRSREWTAALSAWCAEQPQLGAFAGSCLVHRAEIMQLGGEWGESIAEARRACERVSTQNHDALADAYYQQAEIHRLRGELAEAEAAYRAASEWGRQPQPGLALLRHTQGRRDEAVSAIRQLLATTSQTWRRAQYLPACVDIMLGAGELDEARAACDELEQIAAQFDLEVLAAMAARARGAVQLAGGDAQGAVEPLRRGLAEWLKVGAPYLAARTRALLARAYRELGDRDSEQLERDAARTVFERLGAATDLAALEGGAPAVDRCGLSPRELEVLRLVASGKTNKEVASELCLSERTIDRHVSNIFTKLDVSTRAAATAFAYEHNLL